MASGWQRWWYVAAIVGGSLSAWAEEPDPLAPLARAIEERPDDAQAYEAYAIKAIGAERFEEAIARLKAGSERIPDFARAHYLLGYAHRKRRAWSDAAAAYRRFIELRPEEIDAQFGLGKALLEHGDRVGALAALRKYVAEEQRPQMARYLDEAKADIARLEGEAAPPTVAAVAPPIATPSAPDGSALRLQAEGLRTQRKLPEAAQAFQRAIDAEPGRIATYGELSEIYFALQRYADAATVLRGAVDRDPNYSQGWYNLAHALRQAGRSTEAIAAWRRYIPLRPEDPDPYYGLGFSLKSDGDRRGAAIAFRRYLELEKRPEERRWVERVRQELKELGEP